MRSARPSPRTSLHGLVTVLALVAAVVTAPAGSFAQAPAVVDELLVGFHAGVSDADAEDGYKSHGASKVEKLRGLNVHRVKVPPQALEAIENALAKRKEVKFVERNRQVASTLSPNDPSYGTQWHLPKIGAPQAWDVTQGSSSVVVAVVDSGIYAAHPEFAGKLVPGYNFVDNNTNTEDVYGHGTWVAGVLAATGNNAVGVAGVTWQSRIMPVRVSNSTGVAYLSAIANGMTWAADHGAKVVNISFYGVAGSPSVTSAAQYVLSKGGIVVAAAGNCACLDSTAENPYMLSVAGTDQNDARWTSSSQGNYVDLSAPAVSLPTTNRGGGYVTVQGTSFSAPIVAGVLALMRAANPQLSPTDLKNLLLANTDDKGPTGWDSSFGFGRVNAYRAVAAATASVVPPDTAAPTVAIGSPTGGTTVTGSVTVAVTASDNTSVSAVDLYVNGNYFASDTAAPHSFLLDTTKFANGANSIQARASDPAGNTGQSSPLALNIANVADTVAPIVSITSVTITGKGNTQQVNVSVSAVDNVGVNKVELFVDGQLKSTKTAPPFSFSFSLRQYSSGSHPVQAKGYDAARNVGTSAQGSFVKQ